MRTYGRTFKTNIIDCYTIRFNLQFGNYKQNKSKHKNGAGQICTDE